MNSKTEVNKTSKRSIAAKYVDDLLGLSHLTTAEIYWLNLDYHRAEQTTIVRLYDHLAECRLCRVKVRALSFDDFKRSYPAHYSPGYVLQQYNYYTDPDPPPAFDEKISWREKLRRFYKYRENYFFDADEISEWLRRSKLKIFKRS